MPAAGARWRSTTHRALRPWLKAQSVRELERGALQWKPELLVVEGVEQVVDRDDDRMLSREAVRRRRVNDREVVVVDDRETGGVEIVVLATLHVAACHARAQTSEVQVHASADGVEGHIQNVLLCP